MTQNKKQGIKKMDTNTIMLMGNFIAVIAMFITVVALIMNQNKKFDEINKRLTVLEIEVIKINGRFNKVEANNTNTNTRVDDTNKIVAQINENYQNLISKIIDKIDTSKTIETPKTVIN